jgi:predicted MPP superfamily phosphohydrolase
LKFRSSGRGSGFSAARGIAETVQRAVYAGSWPARVLNQVPAATRVRLIEHELVVSGAGDEARAPLRLAFISDLHIGPLTPRRLLDNAFRLLTEAAPDVLVLGGDYVFLEVTRAMARELEARVAAVPARTKLAVLGNHDLWTQNDVIEAALERAGCRVLVNDAARLPAPHDRFAIVGIDEPWTGRADGARAFASCADAPIKIAVSHAPEGLPFVEGRGAKLLLCGHTHGGQICLPSGPVVVHGPLGRRWPSGLHRLGDMHLFVSRGIGLVDLPLRAYAPSDVALFTLR